MIKGIILFDLKDFLYQGTKGEVLDVEMINRKQSATLDALHQVMMKERERRLNSDIPVPVVDIFLPTGDGYYFLCPPALSSILDISKCIMAILNNLGVKAYCVAHIGDLNIFKDMTGRDNATGFDLGYAARLQSVSNNTEQLVCSENLIKIWRENSYFRLEETTNSKVGKDGIEYNWKNAVATDFKQYCSKFS